MYCEIYYEWADVFILINPTIGNPLFKIKTNSLFYEPVYLFFRISRY